MNKWGFRAAVVLMLGGTLSQAFYTFFVRVPFEPIYEPYSSFTTLTGVVVLLLMLAWRA